MNATLQGYNASPANLAQGVRQGSLSTVREALLKARERTLLLADEFALALGTQHPAVPYSPEINPPLWELGHIAWFQEYWIARNSQRALGTRCDPLHERRASLLGQADHWFDSSHVAHRTRWTLPLPSAEEIRNYLAGTFAQTLETLDALPSSASDDDLYFFRLVALHEEMHAEAATYMAQTLGISAGKQELPAEGVSAPRQIQIATQTFALGWAEPGFAFDNELAQHEVEIASFQIDAQPVSWASFLAFVEAGGYEQQEWWASEAWSWLNQQRSRLPRYVRMGSQGWEQQRLGRWRALDLSQPTMHVTAFEAQAWCRWVGRRLPTEAEWECAATTAPGFAWGRVWEWMASAFVPYPGFVPHPYRDYSQPWFDSRRVLRGASHATSPTLVHPRYRNFFEPHRNDIFAGFRSCA